MTYEMLYKQIRKLAIFLIGISIVLIGCILFFTPGPAIIVIPIGLAVLATEFIWAKKLLNKFKEKTSSISKSAKKVIKKNFK
jgi:5-bromo-4-chloroindolyl phosphate hydrolysis protein